MAMGTSTSASASVFVTTSLGTRLCVAIPTTIDAEDTVTAASLKLSLAQDHLRAFPHLGPVLVTALQTSFQGQGPLFTLAHSLPLSLLLPHSPPHHLLLTAILLPVPPPPPPAPVIPPPPNAWGQDNQANFNISHDPGAFRTSSTSHQKRTKKTNNKAKEATSIISSPLEYKTDCINDHVSAIRPATQQGDSADKGAELEGSCSSNNAPVFKEFVSQDMVPPDRKKLLVLDVDGLLAHISYAGYKDQQHAHFEINGKSVFRRPFCADFLMFCFSHFEVGVWSSRVQRNLEKAVDYLFGAMRGNLLFCWGQSKCTPTEFKTLENRPLFLKDLSKLWDKVEPGLPWEKGRFSPTNTLLVDYNPCKASLNPPWTAIFPFPYNKNHEDIALGPGGEIRVYLEKIAAADDVPKYVEGHPFGLAAWRKHPRWKHYIAMRKSLLDS